MTHFDRTDTHILAHFSSPTLKYLTVLTLSSRVASSSHTIRVLLCIWKAETVHMWHTPSSIALYSAMDLLAPVINTITSLAFQENNSCFVQNESRYSIPCVHDSAHTHSERLLGNSVDVASKEPRF